MTLRPPRESGVERRCCDAAAADGWGNRKMTKRDDPDRIFFKKRFLVWVEIKRPGEVPRPSQLRRHAELRAAGEIVLVVDTSEGFVEKLNEAAR